MEKIILASASPRRREILKNIGVPFRVAAADVDESRIKPDGNVGLYVQELALLKASALLESAEKTDIIIAADTVVYYNGEILGKPADEAVAFKMLKSLSANKHEVYTGFCVMRASDGYAVCKYVSTDVWFKSLDDDKIRRYISTGEPLDKAGAYGIQGRGALLIDRIEGDYFNVVGLPISTLGEVLEEEFNVKIFQFCERS